MKECGSLEETIEYSITPRLLSDGRSDLGPRSVDLRKEAALCRLRLELLNKLVRSQAVDFLLAPAVPVLSEVGGPIKLRIRIRIVVRIASVHVRRDTKTVQWHLIRQAELRHQPDRSTNSTGSHLLFLSPKGPTDILPR